VWHNFVNELSKEFVTVTLGLVVLLCLLSVSALAVLSVSLMI